MPTRGTCAALEAMLTIAPRRWRRNTGSVWRNILNAPPALTFRQAIQSALLVASVRPMRKMPAPLTSTSSSPCSASSRVHTRSTASASAISSTSVRNGYADSANRRSKPITSAPASANCRAVCKPMPAPAPVTHTRLPLKSQLLIRPALRRAAPTSCQWSDSWPAR